MPSSRVLRLAATLVSLTGIGPALHAQTTTSATLDSVDMSFVLFAAQDCETEVRLGKIAAVRGSTPAVKNFGVMMTSDHTIANGQLQALAFRRGVQVPAALDREHQKLIDAWTKKDSANFDRAYAEEMVSAHKRAISAFEEAATRTKDAELKGFVDATLPTLRHHLQMAEALKTTVK